MNELYNILSIYATSGLFLGCGLMFLFMVISDSPLLGNYRKARYAMACAYLFFVVINIVEYLFGDTQGENIAFLQTIVLATAISQALLFTFAMIALLEVRFPGWRYIRRETAFVLMFIAAVFTVYALCSETCFRIAFYGFAGIYALLLVHYTVLFIRNYKQFRYRMDNYYSDEKIGRLRWVVFSFFAALVIGVMALLSSVFMSIVVALIYTIIFDIFYIFFAIRFINYAHRFHVIEQAMDEAVTQETILSDEQINLNSVTQKDGLTDDKKACLSFSVLNTIENGLKTWTKEKLFLKPGITIGEVSKYIGTNNKYLSLYINKYMNKTFREWINVLKIEEAKHLLLKYPDMDMNEIALRTGFATKSHFGEQFRTINGISPSNWRQQSLKENDFLNQHNQINKE
jgi:AraC-like DNA-binding protein